MKKHLQEILHIIRSSPQVRHFIHKSHTAGHLGYLSFVFIEGHTIYSIIAGGLAVVIVVAHFVGEDVE